MPPGAYADQLAITRPINTETFPKTDTFTCCSRHKFRAKKRVRAKPRPAPMAYGPNRVRRRRKLPGFAKYARKLRKLPRCDRINPQGPDRFRSFPPRVMA